MEEKETKLNRRKNIRTQHFKNMIIAPSILSADFSKLGEEIKKIDNVVAGIMEMSEPKAEPYERCDINRLLAEALIRTRHSKLAHKIRSVNIVEDYSMLPFVLLPPKSMVRAFYNILENALDATPANGNIRLKTRLIHKDHGKDSLIRIWISKMIIRNRGIY